MDGTFVNISGISSMANSLEVLMYVAGERNHQVLLEVSTNNSNETWYLEKTLSPDDSQVESARQIKVMVENLNPLTKYVLCPRVIDDLGKIWSEGACRMASTGPKVDCTEAIIIASVFFGLLLMFLGVGYAGYRLFHKGLRKGFNLPNLSRTKE